MRKNDYTDEQLATIRKDISDATQRAHERGRVLFPHFTGAPLSDSPAATPEGWDLGRIEFFALDGIVAARAELEVLVPIDDEFQQEDMSRDELVRCARRWHRYLLRELMNGDVHSWTREKLRAVQSALGIFENA